MDADTFRWRTQSRIGGTRLTLRAFEDGDGATLAFESAAIGGERAVPLSLEESDFLADALPAAIAVAESWGRTAGEADRSGPGAGGGGAVWETDADLGETKARLCVSVADGTPELIFHSTAPGRGLGVMPLSRNEGRFLAQSMPGAMAALNRWIEIQETMRGAERDRLEVHTWADVPPGRWWEDGRVRSGRITSPAPPGEPRRGAAGRQREDGLESRRRQRAEAVREYGTTARQLACLVTERVHSDNPVHRLDIESELVRVLAAAGRSLDGRETGEARRIAAARADADLRVSVVTRLDPGNAIAAETARFQGEPFFVQPGKLDEWRSLHLEETRSRIGHEAEPTRLETLVAAARAIAGTDRERLLGRAMATALGYGSPPLAAADLQRERQDLIRDMSSPDPIPDDRRERTAARLYRAFSAKEIRAMAGRPEGRVTAAFRAAHGPRSETIAASIAELHGARLGTPAPWYGLYEALGADLRPERSRTAGLSIAAA